MWQFALVRTQPVIRADHREAQPFAISPEVSQLLAHCIRVADFGGNIELFTQLPPPLRSNHFRTYDEQALRVSPGLEFEPDEGGLDGFAEADFIREKQALGRRLDELQDRTELVGEKINLRRVHRIQKVVKCAPQLLESQQTLEVFDATELATLLVLGQRFQVLLGHELALMIALSPFHLNERHARHRVHAPGCQSDTAWIGGANDWCIRRKWHCEINARGNDPSQVKVAL